MRGFEARALENITTAPATRGDRLGALALGGVLLVLLLVAVPFGRLALDPAPAFLTLVTGSSILALLLTAVLLFVQHRVTRDARVGLMAVGYGFVAAAQTMYLLTFPEVFSAEGLLGAGPQTAAWWYVAGHLALPLLFVRAATLRRVESPPGWFRRAALLALAVFLAAAALFTAGERSLPVLVHGNAFGPVWARVLVPILALGMLGAAAIVGRGFDTVARTWLPVVVVAQALELVVASDLGGSRYALAWYLARCDTLIAATVVLAVFLAKINDLMLRLAARSSTTAEQLAAGEARYASLANVVPQLIFTTDSAGRLEYVNDRWVAYTGLHVTGRDDVWTDPLHEDDVASARARWDGALRGGESFAAEWRLRERATGRYRWFLVNGVPVRGRRGDVVAWIGTATDIDAQKQLEEREAFLARAGERLGASLDVTATVAAIKTLLIPRLAERSWVALTDEDGRFILSGIGSTDIGDELDTRRWIGAPLQPALHDAVARIVAGGEAFVVDKPDRFPDPWLRELPPGAAMVVPLISGDVAIGALALVRSSGRAYDGADVTIVREFARRAALSLQHARLYERERATADALQRAMLPAQLPRLPDLRFSASYSAASESQRVGGDFYDAFELPDGRVALTIGDVTGHGLEAAVIMGEIRQAIRAAAFEAAEPSTILDRASRLLVASGRTVFVTAIFGVLDPVTGRLTYATAGHPPPVVDESGVLRRLSAAGLPIGLREGEGVDFVVRLHAPCTLVLYTDGLLEFARDIADGERRIENAIRTLGREEIDHLANALMKTVLGEDEATDDIAILTVSIERFATALAGEERIWTFASTDGATAALVRREAAELTAAWTGRDGARYGAELALGELLANAVRHAPGAVRVALNEDGLGRVTLSVEDRGPGFTPSRERCETFAESGRGLELVRASADGVAIDAVAGGGTRVTLEFAAAPGAVAALAVP